MANLKGKNFKKQIRDAKIRLDARGVKRYGNCSNSGLAHSHRILTNRVQILKRFAKFLKSIRFKGKLNKGLTIKNLIHFFTSAIKNMSPRSREMFFSSFSSLINGLRTKNIKIDPTVDYEFFQRCKDKYAGRPDDKFYKKDRYINQKDYYRMEQKIALRSRLAFHLQYHYGYRISEAVKIGKNIENYVKNGLISGVRGKGGQIYPDKIVKEQTLRLIEENGEGDSVKNLLQWL